VRVFAIGRTGKPSNSWKSPVRQLIFDISRATDTLLSFSEIFVTAFHPRHPTI
jgi:hypothetical protein